MPEDNEADVNIQGAAPDGGGRGVTDWSVWVIGHSYIYWAERRARSRPIGGNLGLNVPVHWRGIRGLQWPRLLQESLFTDSWSSNASSSSHNMYVPCEGAATITVRH
ncbi:uncharacterized protein [Eleutherodactylus coqui]